MATPAPFIEITLRIFPKGLMLARTVIESPSQRVVLMESSSAGEAAEARRVIEAHLQTGLAALSKARQ